VERERNAKVYIVDSGKDDDTLFGEKFGVAKPWLREGTRVATTYVP